MPVLIASLKLFAFALACLIVVLTQSPVLLFTRGPGAYIVPCIWHRVVCKIFNIRFEIEGTPETNGQVLLLSNHISYLDIPVLGSVLKASFVAKKDVESWPVFGFLAKLQQTAFINRSRSAAQSESNSLSGMLSEGKSLIIFPEGTSTDGREVRPFKSSLFALPLQEEHKDLIIQTLTIRMEMVDSSEVTSQDIRDIYSWHIDMTTELPEHLWRFAKSRGAVLKIKFHAPLRAGDFQDRKVLAQACHDQVSAGLTQDMPLKQAA